MLQHISKGHNHSFGLPQKLVFRDHTHFTWKYFTLNMPFVCKNKYCYIKDYYYYFLQPFSPKMVCLLMSPFGRWNDLVFCFFSFIRIHVDELHHTPHVANFFRILSTRTAVKRIFVKWQFRRNRWVDWCVLRVRTVSYVVLMYREDNNEIEKYWNLTITA